MNVLGKATNFIAGRISKNAKKRFEKNPPQELKKAEFDYMSEPKSDYFTVGFGKTVIMPPDMNARQFYVAGYRGNNPATGVLDELMVRAVYIDDNSGRGGVVFVSTDTIGLFKYDTDIIKELLADFKEKSGCRSIVICSTHNHASIDTMGLWGPTIGKKIPKKTGRDPEFCEIVREGVKKAVEMAFEDGREGDLYWGNKDVPDTWQRDSRLPIAYSTLMTRLRFVPKDGSREVHILNFASHSESLLGKNSKVSADFPAYLAKRIFEKSGAETAYFVGAIGGLISMYPMDDDNEKSTVITGEALADVALSIENEKKLEAKVNFIKQEFYVEAENYVLIAAAKVGIIPTQPHDIGKGKLNLGLLTEMSYFEIGDFRALFLPGEIYPELVYGGYLSKDESAEGKGPEENPLPLTEIAKDKDMVIFGLANDEIGYIVSPNDFMLHPELPYIDQVVDRLDRRHYEETNSLGPNTAHVIADTFTKMYNKVKAAKEAN
ncbi:MAG TPA: neutral/alkaline non-lysosomal ceramidase N-terminal domain-containing protein [Oscillospiraceae bacterium]|nr:neutral/alkaline non-lysosomal ceramidase N-terminal domain-containing protein [Oscillospiraceae bacterium]